MIHNDLYNEITAAKEYLNQTEEKLKNISKAKEVNKSLIFMSNFDLIFS